MGYSEHKKIKNTPYASLKDYSAVAIETTGLDFTLDRIIEIAAIKVRNNKIIDTFQTLINAETGRLYSSAYLTTLIVVCSKTPRVQKKLCNPF